MGRKGATAPSSFSIYLFVLCFEKRCPKPNIVVRLKSKYLALPKILGWLRHCMVIMITSLLRQTIHVSAEAFEKHGGLFTKMTRVAERSKALDTMVSSVCILARKPCF